MQKNIFQNVIQIRALAGGCEHVNFDLVTNCTLRVRPTRDGHGLMTIKVQELKPLHAVWLTLRFFYRNTRLRFLPFMQGFSYDVCKLMANTVNPDLLFGMIFKGFIDKAPQLFHPCPFFGNISVDNVDMAKIVEDAFPQIIPRGTYKAIWRFFDKKTNVTLMQFWGLAEIKAVDVLQNFQM